MGYRSDVGLALTKKGVETLNAKLAEESVSEDLRESVKRLLSHTDEHYSDAVSGAEVWYWERIKWYDCYPFGYQNICFIMDAVRELDDEDYRFIRIGEKYDDTEVSGGFWENPFDFELTRGMTLSAPA
jgi:hypothetical protein